MPSLNTLSRRQQLAFILLPLVFLSAFAVYCFLYWHQISWQMLLWQSDLHKQMAIDLRAAQSPELSTKLWLLGLCFLYGVFHAVGPGHGKAILSTYLATHHSHLKRAMWISFGAALIQALVAISLMVIVAAVMGWTQIRAQQFGQNLDQFSFWCVIMIGMYLCFRAGKHLWQQIQSHRLIRKPTLQIKSFQKVNSNHAVGIQTPHVHDDHCGCGHMHAPNQEMLAQAQDWKAQLAIMFTMGIRPCTGALLILVLAKSIGLFELGLLAVLIMAAGTGMTVCLMAWFSHTMRHLTLRLLSHSSEHRWVKWIPPLTEFIGGLILILLGYGMLAIVTTQTSPFFMPH